LSSVCGASRTQSSYQIASDGKSIDTSDAEFVINPYEEYALEQAVQLKEKLGGEVTVVTLGPEKTTQVIMKALALGADKAIHLKSDKIPMILAQLRKRSLTS